MDEKYHRALKIGLAFGVLMTCINSIAYLWYQKQMDNYWTSGMSRYVDNLCVGVDTYFFLIILTSVVYVAGGICSVIYTRKYLEWREPAARAAALTGLVAVLLSVPGTGLLILSGIIPAGTYYGAWMLVFGIYALIGISLAMSAGGLYFKYLQRKLKTGPP